MSKCPECGEEIDYLYNVESGDMEYRFNPDGSYEGNEFATDGGRNEYECPKCRKTLFTNETDALEFLHTATHLCETCKHKDECNLAGEIDTGYFDEVLMDRVNDNDREDKNPALTTIVVECKEYEKEGGGNVFGIKPSPFIF